MHNSLTGTLLLFSNVQYQFGLCANQILGKDRQMLSQDVVCSNEMEPDADCIPQLWLKEIGHSNTAACQLFGPRKRMENRCPIKCPGRRVLY